MSALPPKADIRQRIEHVCFVPLADICIPCGAPGVIQGGERVLVKLTEDYGAARDCSGKG
jgi:hypothetical protein